MIHDDPRTAGWKDNLERIYSWFPVLATRARSLAGALSGGQQQMLAIARGLASSPKLLMLDEPSMGLAPSIADEIFDRIVSIHAQSRLTVLLVEQRVAEALHFAQRGYVLEAGRVVEHRKNNPLFSPIRKLARGQSAVNRASPRSRVEEFRGLVGPLSLGSAPTRRRLASCASAGRAGSTIAAMIFRRPPQIGQYSMSISNTRLSRHAQLMRAGASGGGVWAWGIGT